MCRPQPCPAVSRCGVKQRESLAAGSYYRDGFHLAAEAVEGCLNLALLRLARLAAAVHICPELFLVDSCHALQPGHCDEAAELQQQALCVIVPDDCVFSPDGSRPAVLWEVGFDGLDGTCHVSLAFVDGVARCPDAVAIDGVCPEAVGLCADVDYQLFHILHLVNLSWFGICGGHLTPIALAIFRLSGSGISFAPW